MNEGTPATDKKIFMEKPKTLVNNLLIVGWLISPENKNIHQRNLLGWHGLYEMVHTTAGIKFLLCYFFEAVGGTPDGGNSRKGAL